MRVQRSFAANLIGGIGRGARIERLPASFAVKLAAFAQIHRGLVHYFLYFWYFAARRPRHHQGSAAAHALDKDMRTLLADAGIGQRAEQAAGDIADRHAAQNRCKPSGADDGADTGQDPQATFGHIAERLSDYEFAYLHIANPALEQMQSGKDPDLRALDMASTIRRRYKGTLVVAGGFEADTAAHWLREGEPDRIRP
jgi:hypothetical protein